MRAGGNIRKALACFWPLAVLLLLMLGGWLVPEEWVAGSYLEAGQSPSGQHWFGTDAFGRDLFFRTLKGLSVSLLLGVLASLLSGLIAVVVGLGAAVNSRRLDAVICWCIDLFMGIPHTILILLISFAAGRGMKGLLIGIAATHWCSLARLIRAEVIALRGQTYIQIARRLGRSNGYIWLHHMLPQLLPQLAVGMILMFPHAILHEAAISFLGFGMRPEQPAVGIILSESMRYLSAGMWWPAVLPGASLVGVVWLIDLFGESMRRKVGANGTVPEHGRNRKGGGR